MKLEKNDKTDKKGRDQTEKQAQDISVGLFVCLYAEIYKYNWTSMKELVY